MEVGYHYTSAECWEKIQVEGLRPYVISKACLLNEIGKASIEGIWVWQRRMYDLSHIGSIIYQMAVKNTLHVAFLEVSYDLDDCLSPRGQPDMLITLPHSGRIENLQYHVGKDSAVIVTKVIPSENINLLNTYNLLDAWKE
jgi:hypothetical protein